MFYSRALERPPKTAVIKRRLLSDGISETTGPVGVTGPENRCSFLQGFLLSQNPRIPEFRVSCATLFKQLRSKVPAAGDPLAAEFRCFTAIRNLLWVQVLLGGPRTPPTSPRF